MASILKCPAGGKANFLHSEQVEAIARVRQLVAEKYTGDLEADVSPFVELAGDVRLLRFLEGYGNDPSQAADEYIKMLNFRTKHGMDTIRQRLVDHWNDDIHAYSDEIIPHMSTVLRHYPMCLNFSYKYATEERIEDEKQTNETRKGAGAVASAAAEAEGSDMASSGDDDREGDVSLSGDDAQQANGHLLVIEFTGKSNPKALLSALTLEQYIEFELHNMEHKSVLLDRLSRERGYLVKIISVRDMAGLGMQHCSTRGASLITSVLKIMSVQYPEVIRNIVFVNAPWIFSALWKALKPVVAARTVAKILFFDRGSERMRAALVERCGRGSLPQMYGGTRSDPDCLGAVKSDEELSADGPDSTEHPLSADSAAAAANVVLTGGSDTEEDTTTPSQPRTVYQRLVKRIEDRVEVGPGKKHGFILKLGDFDETEVRASSSTIPDLGDETRHVKLVVKYSFSISQIVGTVDIGFSAVFIDSSNGNVDSEEEVRGDVAHAYKRVTSWSTHPYEGEWSTDRSGTFIIEWDNSYSAFVGKGLNLRVDIWEYSVKKSKSPTRKSKTKKTAVVAERKVATAAAQPETDDEEGEGEQQRPRRQSMVKLLRTFSSRASSRLRSVSGSSSPASSASGTGI